MSCDFCGAVLPWPAPLHATRYVITHSGDGLGYNGRELHACTPCTPDLYRAVDAGTAWWDAIVARTQDVEAAHRAAVLAARETLRAARAEAIATLPPPPAPLEP